MGSARLERILAILLLAMSLVPVWTVDYFPSQDGPGHVETANVVLHYADPSYALYREYYTLNLGPGANSSIQLVLAGLLRFVDGATAEKLLVTGYFLVFLLGVLSAIQAVRAENRWLALLGAVLLYNIYLHMGFYNFCYSLAFFMWIVAIFFRFHPQWSWPRFLILAALALVTYLVHPLSFAMGAIAVGILAIQPWRGLRSAIPPVVAFFPAGGLLLSFVFRGSGGSDAPLQIAPARVRDFLFLQSYDPLEVWLCVAAFALFAACAVHRIVHRKGAGEDRRYDALVAVIVASLFVYYVAPVMLAGGSVIKPRLTVYPFLLLLLWLAAGEYGPRFRGVIGIAATALLTAQVSYFGAKYARINERLADYHSVAPFIAPGTTFLPLCFDAWGQLPDGTRLSNGLPEPFLHAAGLIAVETRSLDLLNTQGNLDYFPVLFRPEKNPYRHISSVEKGFDRAPFIEFGTYAERTGGRVDSVIVWGLREDQLASPATQQILAQLTVLYEPVFTSPLGLATVYRKKASP